MNKWIFVAAIIFATSCGTNVHRNQKEMQAISENALQTAMDNNPSLIAGCVSILSVSDGTQMASTSLSRTGSPKDLTTTVSLPIGGLAQTSALMYLRESYGVQYSDKVPTNHGQLANTEGRDPLIADYEYQTGKSEISLFEGFLNSAPYPVSYMADKWISQSANDIESFYAATRNYYGTDGILSFPQPHGHTEMREGLFATVSGRSLETTLYQVTRFYNYIANSGNGVCSRETADSLKVLLRQVVTEGTGAVLRDSEVTVAGKTGIGQVPAGLFFEQEEQDDTPAYYVSFVGFYPYGEPKYTIGVTFFSSPAVSYAQAQSAAREIIEKTVYL